MSKYEVGQHVWIYNQYDRRGGGPKRGTVEKVGRTLVHVSGNGWRAEAYRMETGVINDGYGHSHIRTDEERAESERQALAVERWRAHGIESRHGKRFSADVMERVADLLDTTTADPERAALAEGSDA